MKDRGVGLERRKGRRDEIKREMTQKKYDEERDGGCMREECCLETKCERRGTGGGGGRGAASWVRR